ncbi:MAG: hypothetical protein KF752_03795 [Pirellulaceae bacterium]|nr:hypothetical protein [Pirellulaceae bacterium]
MDFQQSGKILITCQRGLAPWLHQEVSRLGYQPTATILAGVELTGSLNDCIALNVRLRCASHVLFSLKKFACNHPEQLYRTVHKIPWEDILPSDGYFSVSSFVSHPTVRSTMFPNVKIKDAIVDRLREQTGRRPDCGSEPVGAVVYLYWQGAHAELFLDTSGPSLAKHGYRRLPGKAPMMESLAAAILMASRWEPTMPLVNPMCGSGTLAIEAALMLTQRVPGLFRQHYAVEHVVGYDPQRLRAEQTSIGQQIVAAASNCIYASDISPQAIETARANAQAAGVGDVIQFETRDFYDTPLPNKRPMVVMFNPEYGSRLGEEQELKQTYAQIGDFFKQRCADSWGYVFTGNLNLAKCVGLRTKRRLEFQSAQIDCRLLEYELYSGSRRAGAAEVG